MRPLIRKSFRIFVLLFFCASVLFCFRLFSKKKAIEDAQYLNIFKSSYKIFGNKFPKDLSFAGEPIPLPDSIITENILNEFDANSFYLSHAALLKKKYDYYFHIIDPILKKNEIPEDFKYIPLMESNFTDTVNYKGARGFWQMMLPMAENFGLLVNDTIDERSDVKKSTEAVCKYLCQSKEKFGSWIYALASLNYGSEGLENILKKNNPSDCIVNKETTDYIFRILFLKEIFERPELYTRSRKKPY